MFSSKSEREQHAFTTQNYDGFIPGYTGHCPTLKFQYGRTYGFRTKEILKEIRSKRFYNDADSKQDYHQTILHPIMQNKEKFLDFTQNYRNKPPPYISGYTGFIPTLNFRYGKPYNRAVDDSICEIRERERSEIERLTTTTKSVPPRLKQSVRSQDEVQTILNNYLDKSKYKSHKISPEHPPITGYTGHIPRVIGNEESLSHSYHITVINGLKRLQQEKEKFENLKKSHNKVLNVLEEYKNLHK